MATATRTKRLTYRQQLVVDHLPWVRLLSTARSCDGRTGRGGRNACKNPAYWKFTSLKRRSAWAMNLPNGVYCWSHLLYWGLYGSMDEEARTLGRYYEVGVLCPSTSDRGTRCVRRNDGHTWHHSRTYTRPYEDEPDRVRWDEEWGVRDGAYDAYVAVAS